ncbi:MAG: SGNH/GDSL hydrolase family protein [Armatimonadota bacterium]
MALQLAPGSKLVMIGDSVTDCGRAQPVGEGLFGALGNGYVANVDALLSSTYPDLHVRVVNMGTSGHNVRDLKARWATDVLGLKPDWVSVMIGINDIWRQFDSPRQTECHVYLDEYERTLDELVGLTAPHVKGLVLMTPVFIEPNPADLMRAQADLYGAAMKRVAEKHGTCFADTQAAFNRVLASCPSAAIAWDRVHPNHIGHMVLARAFLGAVGFEWS